MVTITQRGEDLNDPFQLKNHHYMRSFLNLKKKNGPSISLYLFIYHLRSNSEINFINLYSLFLKNKIYCIYIEYIYISLKNNQLQNALFSNTDNTSINNIYINNTKGRLIIIGFMKFQENYIFEIFQIEKKSYIL